ncbi:MAG: ABC transporter permease [Bacteroidota bacterium]|nr:ABC transporter permease [Sphingobacteriales bacterium]
MKISYFIAKRLSYSKGKGTSGLIVRIAIASVAISIAVMICTFAIVKGYQLEIRNKITGFGSHIQISRLDLNNSYETIPVQNDTHLVKLMKQQRGVAAVQPIGIKAGIIKTAEEFQGVVIKGVDKNYDWKFIKQYLQEGGLPHFNDSTTSQELMLSAATASKLHLKLNDAVVVYFVQDPPRVRKFKVIGIYKTGYGELDELYAFADLKQIQKLNNWNENQISGYELKIDDFTKLDNITESLMPLIPYHLEVLTIRQLQPQIFEWLGFLDLNAIIIIILMLVVACINMITALLILIVERSNMVGLLKAFGAPDRVIASTFIYMASYLVLVGLALGNSIGLLLCLSQKYWGWFKLSQESYYLSEVPVQLGIADILILNSGAFIVCYLVLLLPSAFISRITPVKAIRFE